MLLNRDLITDWEWQGPHPTNYGTYHILWLVGMVVVTFLLAYFVGRKHNKKKDDAVIFIIGTMLILIEIYKQIFYTLDAGYYQWYAFPFQFCSVPMYVAFIAPLLKDGKIKEAMYKFLAFFGLLAGLSVMLYPSTCLSTSYVTILIHTMLWHSSMVVMGVYLVVSRGYAKNINSFFKELLPGLYVFIGIVTIAVLANIIAYHVYFKYPELNIYNEKFFLLYLSPYYDSPLPILADIKETSPFIVYLGLYLLAFGLGVSLVWSITLGIRKLVSLITSPKKVKSTSHANIY